MHHLSKNKSHWRNNIRVFEEQEKTQITSTWHIQIHLGEAGPDDPGCQEGPHFTSGRRRLLENKLIKQLSSRHISNSRNIWRRMHTQISVTMIHLMGRWMHTQHTQQFEKFSSRWDTKDTTRSHWVHKGFKCIQVSSHIHMSDSLSSGLMEQCQENNKF